MQKVRSHINSGFSLVEILVAASVFLVFVSAIATIAVSSGRQAKNAVNKERAAALAEEAIEASRNLRDADFANLVDGTHGLNTLNGVWNYSGLNDASGIFTRSLTISSVNENQKKIDVVVSWSDPMSDTNAVTSSTYLTDWRKLTGGVGQIAYVTIQKVIAGGSLDADHFAPYNVGSQVVSLGVATAIDPGSYIVSEKNDINYTQTFSGDCDVNGLITVVAGTSKSCTITNTPTVIPVQQTFTITKQGNTYRINGNNDPILTLIRGKRYVFDINTPDDPFWIKSVRNAKTIGTANAYNVGVQNNGIAVGQIIFDVPLSAPSNDLYYISQNSFLLSNNINTIP